MSTAAEPTVSAQDEVVDLLVDLIRINTANPTNPERPAAEWVAARLDEVGIDTQIIEAAPGRASTIARIEGSDSSRPPLLIHGHLDVVPADAAEWSVDPFAGEVRDGYVWGRGAVDMKDMDAMVLALVRDGRAPVASHRATSCWPSCRTRRPAAARARTTSSTTIRTCSPTAPRRSARSAGSACRSTTPHAST